MINHRNPTELRDRGQISPMTYLQMRYQFEHRNTKLEKVSGDKCKKWLIPLLIPVIGIGWVWKKWEIKKASGKKVSPANRCF
jgi:hypothetical protein